MTRSLQALTHPDPADPGNLAALFNALLALNHQSDPHLPHDAWPCIAQYAL